MRILLLLGLCISPLAHADDLCASVGKPDGLKECRNGRAGSTLTCLDGYVVTGTMKPAITLSGRTPFSGCTLIDPCRVFGYSGKLDNVVSCSNGANGQRTITCLAPFVVSGTTGQTIKLLGATPFPGCVTSTEDHCKRYGVSGKPANVKECVNGAGQRTITCIDGAIVTGTGQPSIVLVGGKPFPGCAVKPVDLCAKPGYSGKPQNAESCVNGDNLRTITCQAGFVVAGTTERQVRLVGEAPFEGCVPKPGK